MAKKTISKAKKKIILPEKRVKRRTYKEFFLEKLGQLSGNEQKLINNKTLLTALNWSEDRYRQVKEGLIAENTIIVGKGGPGGAVSLAQPSTSAGPKPLSLFISYSHQDEAIKTQLDKHLSPLKRLNLIASWHDRKIEAGDAWEKVINDNLKRAEIVVLLISIDFINSEYCYDIEMEEALDRAAINKTVIIPVIARNCLWKNTRFAPYQALPTDGRAIKTWGDQDEALSLVAEGIQKVAERLLAAK